MVSSSMSFSSLLLSVWCVVASSSSVVSSFSPSLSSCSDNKHVFTHQCQQCHQCHQSRRKRSFCDQWDWHFNNSRDNDALTMTAVTMTAVTMTAVTMTAVTMTVVLTTHADAAVVRAAVVVVSVVVRAVVSTVVSITVSAAFHLHLDTTTDHFPWPSRLWPAICPPRHNVQQGQSGVC